MRIDEAEDWKAMRCPNCQTINPPHAKFCLECGNRLVVCLNCGTVNLPFAKFCIECGTPLSRDQNGREKSSPYNGSESGGATEALPDMDTPTSAGGSHVLPASNEYKRAETVFEGNRNGRATNGWQSSGSDETPQERRVVT